MVNDSDRTVVTPLGAMYRYGAGAQYQWNEHVTTGLSYEFLWEGSLPLHQSKGLLPTVTSGEFTNTLINFFSLNLIYKF